MAWMILPGRTALDAVEELDELLVGVARHATADHGAVEDVEGGEQGGRTVALDPRDLDHDAVMRIGGRAPERWAHSTRRPESHSWVRVTTTSDRHRMPATFAVPRLRKSCRSRRLKPDAS